jgi:putative lipoprotein
MRPFIVLLSALCLMLAACDGGGREAETASLTGTVTYLQRVALPPEAEVYVVLEDVSLQDAPAGMIAETTFPTKGKQVPIPFTIKYNARTIEESHSYTVRAEIRVDGQARFMSGQSYPVLTRGATNTAEIIVMALQQQAPAHSALVGTYWKLVELAGKPVAKSPTGREPHMMLLDDPHRVEATGGCNQMSGDYQTTGESLKVSRMVSTQRACPDGMDRDQALAKALEATTGFRVDADRLEITNAKGAVLARFVAATNEE